MKKLLILVFFLPLIIFSHEQDKQLFSTSEIKPGVLLLLDRSTSMIIATTEYDTTETVTRIDLPLKNYDWSSATELEGWYDSELTPPYPYEMGSFDNSPADDDWVLTINGQGGNDTVVVNSWILRFYSGGSYTDFSGGSFGLKINDDEVGDTISVTGLGTVDSVECYVNVIAEAFTDSVWHGGWHGHGYWQYFTHQTEIGEISITLTGPAVDLDISTFSQTRMQSALLVLHSLLDANGDGVVNEEDEELLPVKLGQGFHQQKAAYVPEESYTYNAYSDLGLGMSGYIQRYNENTQSWENLSPGVTYTQHTDTLGTPFDSLWNHINNTELGALTPNGVLIGHGIEYINSYRASHPDLWCMTQNVILITDGESNFPRETCHIIDSIESTNRLQYGVVVPDSEYTLGARDLVRETYMAWHDDSVRVFTVGFGTGIGETGKNQLNWAARWGGTCANPSAVSGDTMVVDPTSGCPSSSVNPRNEDLSGYAYIADNATALAGALQEIFQQIAGQREKGFSSAEVTSIEEDYTSTGYEARMYLASFFPGEIPFWEGHLRSVKLVTGGLSFNDIPDSLVYWNAGDLLRNRDPATRNIYGVKDGSLQEFNSSNFDSADLDVASSSDASEVINLVRGGSSIASDSAYLGDIFHSSPLRVGSPSAYYIDDAFDDYRDSMIITRSTVIYAGSNTGMFHAFADSSGEELFAVVPHNFVSQVKALADTHRFYVDADAMAADVWFPQDAADTFKNKNEWRTVLMSAQGEGGRAVTALDVTDPTSPSHLFSFEHDTMGLTTSVPIMYKVSKSVGTDTVDRFFAFFGGGECPDSLWDRFDPANDSDSLKGNVIVALDIYQAYMSGLHEDSTFWFIPPASGDADKMVYPFASAGSMVNLNSKEDNLYDVLYIPDLAGQMWKVDVRDPDVSNWEAKCMFQPPIPDTVTEDSLSQPAFFAPLIEREPALGCYWIFYGTGDRAHIFKESVNNRFYAILDTTTTESGDYPLTEDDLQNAWTVDPFDLSADFPDNNGWFISYSDSLTHIDEKTVSQPVLLSDTLIFSTFEPSEAASDCNVGSGGAREYYCQYKTGSGHIRNLGSGIPQAPRYSFSMDGDVLVVHQTSDSILVETGTSYGTLKRVLKWLER